MIPTYLSTVLTSCTPNPSTWSCFPYRTYNSSASGPADSLTTFHWLITSNPSNPAGSDYQISSSRNPFALTFANQSLTLTDPGSEDDEAWTFEVAMDKVVVPNADISSAGDGSASRCLFNGTRFQAKLYTKRPKTYPPPELTGDGEGETDVSSSGGGGGGGGASQPFQPWPYAVEIAQTIAAGSRVPDCYQTLNGQLGERIELTGQVSEGAECACEYLNYGT